MKKNLTAILSAVAILGLLCGVAAAPLETRSINFLDVRFIAGKGYVFFFEMTGKFKENELKGTVSIGNDSFPLDCNVRDDGTLGCLAGGSLAAYAGRQANVRLAGFAFYGIAISEKPECDSIAIKITTHKKSTGEPTGSNTLYVPQDEVRYVLALVQLFNILPGNPEYMTVDSIGCSSHEPEPVT